MNKRVLGASQEQKAGAYLEEAGYQILEYNYQNRSGEIDIIAKEGQYLVFVEVKYRKNRKMGSPLEAVGQSKQRHICRVALHYLLVHGLGLEQPCRFDVVSVEEKGIFVMKDAFPFRIGRENGIL